MLVADILPRDIVKRAIRNFSANVCEELRRAENPLNA